MIALKDQVAKAEEDIRDLCHEARMMVAFHGETFPVMVTIKKQPEKQMTIYGESDQVETAGGRITLIFDHELQVSVDQGFFVADDLLNRIRNKAKKWHYLFLQDHFAQACGDGDD